ncbi:response regulator [Gemmata sp. JC673]|uniref:Response regulator n=1 Tax=Gemmata algarum TaxID=2975278 RepID=A0ABU5FCL9_9BACT|nr:response regulator [Gemmata algarum]MDY3563561.1 response regulator [Gemmata algarum]
MSAPVGSLVLVVDDDPAVRAVVSSMVTHLGHTALVATCGAEAVALAAEHNPPAALLDVLMPGMDGPATLDALRACDPGIQCAFLTGNSGAYGPDELLGRGAVTVLAKPVTLTALGAALELVLSLATV